MVILALQPNANKRENSSHVLRTQNYTSLPPALTPGFCFPENEPTRLAPCSVVCTDPVSPTWQPDSSDLTSPLLNLIQAGDEFSRPVEMYDVG
ncbi:hypothetical protein WMY93_026443 [Mugilogobius chulae]|uniref:Uncharacterized protein n=1 Tax=Mugilogobius chulae TaxID=88201 RepID=A0AAW0N4A2_9GOBI